MCLFHNIWEICVLVQDMCCTLLLACNVPVYAASECCVNFITFGRFLLYKVFSLSFCLHAMCLCVQPLSAKLVSVLCGMLCTT